jgi:hypothetical protein
MQFSADFVQEARDMLSTEDLEKVLQDHFLYLHCPLHRGPRVGIDASHGLLLSPPEKRTFHVLTGPDI